MSDIRVYKWFIVYKMKFLYLNIYKRVILEVELVLVMVG